MGKIGHWWRCGCGLWWRLRRGRSRGAPLRGADTKALVAPLRVLYMTCTVTDDVYCNRVCNFSHTQSL